MQKGDHRMMWCPRSVVLSLLLLSISACGSGSSSTNDEGLRRTISGVLILRGEDDIVVADDRTTCIGTRGFDDVRHGVEVVVRDGKNEVLARSELGTGEVTVKGLGESFGERPSAKECTFTFRVTNVPDASFYTIAIGTRGELTYSRSDLITRKWRIEFVLD